MKRFIYVFWILTSGFSAVAQAPDRATPPPLGKTKNLQLPSIQHFKLSNGLAVVLMEKHTVPLIQAKLIVQSGSFDDPYDKTGLASFTLEMMDEGAGALDALQLADEIEFLGANISPYSSNFHVAVDCFTPTSKLDASLKLMSDIVLKPRFENIDIERIRKLRLNTLLQNFDEPSIIARAAFNKYIFDPALPYGRFPNETTVKSFTKEDLTSFHKKHFVTGNSTLIIVGDVTKTLIVPMLENYFSSYPKGTVEKSIKPEPKQVKGRSIYFVDKPGAAQSVIRIGRIGASRSSEDYFSIGVMNTIFGGSFASRLNTNLREEHGYTYGAGSSFNFWPISGPFTSSAAVQTDVTAPALSEFFNEFKKMLKPLPETDLSRGKNYDALGYAGDFETNDDLADALAEMVIHRLPENYFNTYVGNVLSVTKKSVEHAAKKYISPDNMLIIIVGDREKVEDSVKKLNLGKITFLSIEEVLGKKPEL